MAAELYLSSLTMAYPSTPTWRTTTSTTIITRKDSAISGYFFFFSTIYSPQHYKRSRLTTFSVEPSSASSCPSCSTTAHSSTLPHVTNKKQPLQNGRNYDGSFSVVYFEDSFIALEKEEEEKGKTGTITSMSNHVGYISPKVKKRSFWRKILSASKIRSILLLNVITIVNGMFLTFTALLSKN